MVAVLPGRSFFCFNPLLIGEAAPPLLRVKMSLWRLCFNPLLIGEAAPPLRRAHERLRRAAEVSIPFSSGRRRRHLYCLPQAVASGIVSIPFSSGRRRRQYQSGLLLGAARLRFNPLLIGEAAPPRGQFILRRLFGRGCFNPLLIGEAAPPLSKTSPYHTITLSAEKSDVSAHKDLAARRKTATFHA